MPDRQPTQPIFTSWTRRQRYWEREGWTRPPSPMAPPLLSMLRLLIPRGFVCFDTGVSCFVMTTSQDFVTHAYPTPNPPSEARRSRSGQGPEPLERFGSASYMPTLPCAPIPGWLATNVGAWCTGMAGANGHAREFLQRPLDHRPVDVLDDEDQPGPPIIVRPGVQRLRRVHDVLYALHDDGLVGSLDDADKAFEAEQVFSLQHREIVKPS